MTEIGLAHFWGHFLRYLAGLKPDDRMTQNSPGRGCRQVRLNFRGYTGGECIPGCYSREALPLGHVRPSH